MANNSSKTRPTKWRKHAQASQDASEAFPSPSDQYRTRKYLKKSPQSSLSIYDSSCPQNIPKYSSNPPGVLQKEGAGPRKQREGFKASLRRDKEGKSKRESMESHE
jgi:hypothetical protein